MIPKVNRPEDLYAVSVLLSQLELATDLETDKIKVEAQIESADGLTNVDAIARATSRLKALHFGPGDFAASLRMPQTSIGVMDEWDEAYPGHRFHYAMQRIVVAARAAGVRALDGPVADYGDEEGLRTSCLRRPLSGLRRQVVHPPGPDTGSQRSLLAHRRRKWSGRGKSSRPTRRPTPPVPARSAWTGRWWTPPP